MPIKLNVGLAQQIGEPGAGSRGASMNLEMELDSTLVNEPERFKDRVRQIFNLVRNTLAEELKRDVAAQPLPTVKANPPTASAAASVTNGKPHHSKSNGARLATPPQITKIRSLVEAQKLDLDTVLRERCQGQRPEELTVRQASDLIDSLKAPVHPHSA